MIRKAWSEKESFSSKEKYTLYHNWGRTLFNVGSYSEQIRYIVVVQTVTVFGSSEIDIVSDCWFSINKPQSLIYW